MGNKVYAVVKYAAVFAGTLFLSVLLLMLAALIPRKAIRENVEDSAKYLCEGELFGEVIDGVDGSRIDRYADSILLGIAYQYDAKRPLSSVMESAYYSDALRNENTNLYNAVTQGKEANQQYMRYWHGSIALVRPLLMFMNLEQIYVLHFVVLLLLAVMLIALLAKMKARAAIVGIVAGFVCTSAWFVPLSLEYTWMFLLTFTLSILLAWMFHKRENPEPGILFMVGGICANYLDFLTNETLALLIPLLLFVYFSYKKDAYAKCRKLAFSCIRYCALWLTGYAGMWIMKWLLAALVLRKNTLPYVTGHIGERLGGNVGVGFFSYITGAVGKNLKCIFPLEYDGIGIPAFLVIVLGVLYIAYVYRKKYINKGLFALYGLIGIVPYVRYLVLHNHSYLHYFFTYRAQMATVMAIVLIVGSIVDWRSVFHGKAKRRA